VPVPFLLLGQTTEKRIGEEQRQLKIRALYVAFVVLILRGLLFSRRSSRQWFAYSTPVTPIVTHKQMYSHSNTPSSFQVPTSSLHSADIQAYCDGWQRRKMGGLVGRWVANLLARLLATEALLIQIQT
jgi:hypothetical protein